MPSFLGGKFQGHQASADQKQILIAQAGWMRWANWPSQLDIDQRNGRDRFADLQLWHRLILALDPWVAPTHFHPQDG
jgi:hypothetical protein